MSSRLFVTGVTSASLAKATRMLNFSLKVAKYGSSSSTTDLTGFEDVSNTADISDQCLLVKISLDRISSGVAGEPVRDTSAAL